MIKPRKLTVNEKFEIARLLRAGEAKEAISLRMRATIGQVAAIAAHIKMGRYISDNPARAEKACALPPKVPPEREATTTRGLAIFLGRDRESGEAVYWNPDPNSGTANPHVLIVGESGYGKTYTISSLLAELAQRKIHSVVFDFGQGFSTGSLPIEFVSRIKPAEIHASRDGINLNPLQLFPSDILGPVNVAQRVADTFSRVYAKIGVQQHALLRQAILDIMADRGIIADNQKTWFNRLPSFGDLEDKLGGYAQTDGVQGRTASLVASHISTLFVYNTFRAAGVDLDWGTMFTSERMVTVIQLKGLEHSLEKAVTEFLLWHLIGYVESLGPGPLRCFIVLDEAHKLSFEAGSPVEKLLREGRKFGLGLILASQQPEDFSQVAFSNTATKIAFQSNDERGFLARQLTSKARNEESVISVHEKITRAPRGVAYVITENFGRSVEIASFEERKIKWDHNE